jgi:hypothetical protein
MINYAAVKVRAWQLHFPPINSSNVNFDKVCFCFMAANKF